MASRKGLCPAIYRCEHFDRHFCYRAAQGFYLSSGGGRRAPIAHPRYRCAHCGREAAGNRSLCVPARL